MRDFALAPEIEELRLAAERLGRSELEPGVRESEAMGRWPPTVVSVLDGFPLGGLDLPARLGGVDAGCVAKVVLLETLAGADASGLPAADRTGTSTGALLMCPDHELAALVATTCLAGDAGCAFSVVDPEHGSSGLEWGPAWPPPLKKEVHSAAVRMVSPRIPG